MVRRFLLLLVVCLASIWGAEAGNLSLDLSPARWIWYPSGRTLQNTFVLFRKEIQLEKVPLQAKGWILADSRYQLFVNGKRVQWGPAPSDPRWQEADPLDLASYLQPGKNIIACQVCFFGTGDGTHPIGKPGLIFNLDIDGDKIVTDNTWKCNLARSWEPGKYKRWFLRSLQEEFDARLFPYGWNTATFMPGNDWLDAQVVSSNGAEPSVCASSSEYMWEIFGNPAVSEIRRRSIPMMAEEWVPVWKLTESMWIHWKRPVEDYFDMIVPDAFEVRNPLPVEALDGSYEIVPDPENAASLTFEFKEQGVGWPCFTIDAPEGTVVEMLVHEGHKPGGPALINSHFNAWTRFICQEGANRFETFDFESFRWLQLHIRNFKRPVKISSIGMRRRIYPWPQKPEIVLSDDTIQRVMDATVNTLNNCAQETLVDGMARERQQYSGDGSHQMHSVFQAFGESRLPARFIQTFSQGSSIDGYFMDSWPAWDRLARTIERQMQLTNWGPILDHSVGFCFDTYHYYMYTGDKEGLTEVYPRLMKFFTYMQSLTDEKEHLVPVEGLGMCSVYMDHQGYKQSRHKQLALNLYIAAMCRHALLPLCRLFQDETGAAQVEAYGKRIQDACVERFWDKDRKVFINNLPWAEEEKEIRYCDRSLATAVLYDQCPDGACENSLQVLATCPAEMGLSYPCNAVWRLWALAENGRMDVVLKDMKTRWAAMASVWENNTLQEHWSSQHDNSAQWSHCAVAPLMMLYQGIAGVVPLAPGSSTCRVRPQPGNLSYAKFAVQTMRGAIGFESKGLSGNRSVTLVIPAGCEVELWLDAREKVTYPLIGEGPAGIRKYQLQGGQTVKLKLKYT